MTFQKKSRIFPFSYRKQFGKYNIILSDIRKPPAHVYQSGECQYIHTVGSIPETESFHISSPKVIYVHVECINNID